MVTFAGPCAQWRNREFVTMDGGSLSTPLAAPASVRVGNREMPLADFLIGCFAVAGGSIGDGDSDLAKAQRTFLTAGLAALSEVPSAQEWVQLRLRLDTPAGPGLYGELANATRREHCLMRGRRSTSSSCTSLPVCGCASRRLPVGAASCGGA